ncbi:MAG: peptidoglycan-binding protein [Candidatus Eisenbacteria bacterium]
MAILTGVSGCATSGGPSGYRLLRNHEYEEAVRVLRIEEAARPQDLRTVRNLGIALAYAGETEEAIPVLERARALAPADPQSAYHLGRVCEKAGRIDCAIQAYGDYLGLGGKGAAEVRASLQALSIQKARQEIEATLAREAEISAAAIPENTVAVPHFANTARSDTLAPLSRGLAAMVISDLGKVEALRVLERERMQILLDELGLAGDMGEQPGAAGESAATGGWKPVETVEGMQQRLRALIRAGGTRPYYEGRIDGLSGPRFKEAVRAFQAEHGLEADGVPGVRTQAKLEEISRLHEPSAPASAGSASAARPSRIESAVDPATAPRLGRILGAHRLVQGAFVPLAGTQIQLDAVLVQARNGTQLSTGAPVDGPVEDVLKLEKQLVYQILQALGISPTPEERGEIDVLPTTDFLAFLAYSRGLELEDLGLLAEASAAFGEAVSLDPAFEAAQIHAETTAITAEDKQKLEQAELIRSTRGEPASDDRLIRTGGWSDLGPDPDTAGEGDPSITPGALTSSDAVIVIEGDLPQGDAP